MCTTQLVKLQRRLDELTSEGAAVFAMSIDTQEQASRIAQQFGLTFPILSDPGMQVIQRYGLKGEGMKMADLGYVVIDRTGRIVARRTDREFGNHVETLVHEVRRANTG